MAKEILDAILAAEEDAKQRLNNAKKEIVEDSSQFKKDCESSCADAEQQANADAEKAFAEAYSAGKTELEEAKGKAKAECDALSALADKNRESVVKGAVENVLS